MRVKGIGSGYWRVVGKLEELIDKAKEMAQRTLFRRLGADFGQDLSLQSSNFRRDCGWWRWRLRIIMKRSLGLKTENQRF